MEAEKNLLIETIKSKAKLLETVREQILCVKRIPKHSGRSVEARREGNALFSQDHRDAETRRQIFSHYSRSISLAPLNSEELALAYGNRSAFLLRLARYQDCIQDIDRALEITESVLLKAKLYCRKVECLKELDSFDYKNALEEAENCCSQVDGQNKESIIKLINKVKSSSISNEKRVNNLNKNVEVLTETDDFSNCIAVRYNEKYGRYLTAKKDYEPGDIIFVEKLFVTVLNPVMNYTNCNYCLKICWSGIACDYCSWAMFCSEQCKKAAWDDFHNVECSVIFFLKGLLPTIFDSVKTALRMLLVGIREAGCIDKLREDLKSVDECTDVHLKGFYINRKFSSNSILHAYTLKNDGFDHLLQEGSALSIGMVLVTLIEYSQLLPGFSVNKIEDLIQNNDILFIGSLLMKLLAITSNNSHSFISERNCDCQKLKNHEGYSKKCCERGSTLAPLASLINHNCFPNASYCFTEDRKVIIYAVQPIKKDHQIFNSYIGYYFDWDLEIRQNRLKKYKFQCDCVACRELWPPLLTLSNLQLEEKNYAFNSSFERKVFNNCFNIFRALDHKTYDFKKKDIRILCKSITQSKQLKQPSLLTCALIAALSKAYGHIYGIKSPIELFGSAENA